MAISVTVGSAASDYFVLGWFVLGQKGIWLSGLFASHVIILSGDGNDDS